MTCLHAGHFFPPVKKKLVNDHEKQVNIKREWSELENILNLMLRSVLLVDGAGLAMKNYSATSLWEDKNMCCVSLPSFNELLKKMSNSIITLSQTKQSSKQLFSF